MRSVLIALSSILLLAGCGRKYTYEDRDIGYIGAARNNPFLAAERLLEENNYEVSRERGRAELPYYQDALVLPGNSLPNGGERRYKRWIEEGGHLIYLVSGYRRRGWDGSNDLWHTLAENNQEHPLLDEFGISVFSKGGASDGKMRIRGRDLDINMRSLMGLNTDDNARQADLRLETDDETRILSMPVGNGRLTVLASADPIRNRYIGENDHARLMLNLAQLHSSDGVIFIYGKGTTFFAMLRHHGWMALLGLLALIILWIWKNLPRFGPMIPQKDGGDQQFTEHIEMTGRFLWRNKAADALIAPIASHIHREIRQRHPHLAESTDDQVEYFQENTELSREEISDALLGAGVKDPTAMTRTVKNLKTMIESL